MDLSTKHLLLSSIVFFCIKATVVMNPKGKNSSALRSFVASFSFLFWFSGLHLYYFGSHSPLS